MRSFASVLPGGAWPIGSRRLTLARALLGGSATAALLPEIVRDLGGDAATCVRLGLLFVLGAMCSEIPSAVRGDRAGIARVFLTRAGLVQALGLLAIAFAPSVGWLSAAVIVVGLGAGLATGAEARAALSIGGDARTVARLEVGALLGKGTAWFAIALIASLVGIRARGVVAASALLAIVAAGFASTLRIGDRVRAVRLGRRAAARASNDRRQWTSIGVIALLASVAALTSAARGTDAFDAFAITAHGGGLVLCAAVYVVKGIIARLLAPTIARARLRAIASTAVIAAVPLVLAPLLPHALLFPAIAVACGVAGGAAAAARGILLVRLGANRVGTGAALEATLRRLGVALAASAFAPAIVVSVGREPYVGAGVIAIAGGVAALVPRVHARVRARIGARIGARLAGRVGQLEGA